MSDRTRPSCLRVRVLDSRVGVVGGGDVDGHEGHVQPPGAGPGVVEVPELRGLRNVLPPFFEAIRDVEMAIDDDGATADLLG